VDLAASDIEVDVIVGDHPGEALCDARHLEERNALLRWGRCRGGHHGRPFLSSWSEPTTEER
jgi:hypothetical protein